MPAFSPAYGFYDVTSYGAIGDGMADDSAAIAAAETACELKGGVVYFPPGTYLIGPAQSTISIAKPGVQWRGAGAGSSVLIAKSGRVAPIMVEIGSTLRTVNDVALRDLGFRGNNVDPGTGVAPPVIAFGGTPLLAVSACRVLDCAFSENTGATVSFAGVENAEVAGCSFSNVGFFDGSMSGDSTPAVLTDGACMNVRVHHSSFVNCLYDGVRMAATQSEVSSNRFDGCYASAINSGVGGGDGSDIRLISNYANHTKKVHAGGNQAIYIQHLANYLAIANTVTLTDGDGIAGGGCTAGVCLGNIAYDNANNANSCGIQYISQKKQGPFTPNLCIAFIANVCYDDRKGAARTQDNGFKIFTQENELASAFPLIGNTFWGNVSNDISVDTTFASDSDIGIANTSEWLDQQHETIYNYPNGLTGTVAKTSLLNTPLNIGTNSLLETQGVRIVASGSTSGTKHKSFYLGLATTGNLMSLTGLPGSSAHKYWQLRVYIVNNGSNIDQRVMVQFWYDGVLEYFAPASPAVLTNVDVPILLEGELEVPGDNIFCHFVTLERI